MLLATGTQCTGQVSLWELTSSPTCVETCAAASALVVEGLMFSRDGLYLAIISRLVVEIWDVPSMKYVSCVQQEECDMRFQEVKFNYEGDKYLSVSYGHPSKIQVWTTVGGVCERSFPVPGIMTAHFMASNEILYLVAMFTSDAKRIEAITLNISTGERVHSSVTTSDAACGVLVWDYVEANNAVIIAHGIMDRTGMVGKWSLGDAALEWQIERHIEFWGTSCNPIVSSDGSRVAVFGAGLTVDILCALSGRYLASVSLAGCCRRPHLKFHPIDRDVVVYTWRKLSLIGSSETSLMSVYNFLTNEHLWEVEVDCDAVAVRYPTCTLLM
jgi:WD40 repeat protein